MLSGIIKGVVELTTPLIFPLFRPKSMGHFLPTFYFKVVFCPIKPDFRTKNNA